MADARGFGAPGLAGAQPAPGKAQAAALRALPAAPPQAGAVEGGVRLMLRAEGVALLAVALAAYARFGGDWSFVAWTFLLPDLVLLAYFAGPRAGAAAYNAAHSLLVPAGLLALGLAADMPLAFDLALVWTAHIGLDRALGYGLKYARGFGHTHLGSLGPVDPW